MRETEKKEHRFMDADFNIVPFLRALLSKLWLMILVGVLFASVFFCATKVFIKPTYRCGFTAYVNNTQQQTSKEYLTSSDLIAAKELVLTYAQILTSNTVLTASASSIDLDLDYSALKGMVSTVITDDTEIITIYVVHQDPEVAYQMAKAIAKTAPTFMSEIVEGSSMKIVDYPVYNEKRYKPNYIKYALIGFIIGVLLIIVIETIRYFKDDSIKSESEIEMRFSIPVLGVIPDTNLTSRKSSGYYNADYGYGYAKPTAVKEERR